MTLRILVRGGGDVASGAILRMHRAGWQVLVTELERPLCVRRYVSFAQAIYDGEMRIEDARARRVTDMAGARAAFAEGVVPVLVDPKLSALADFQPQVIVDGRMRKKPPELDMHTVPLTIGLGPGFTAGVDCHAVIETHRGPFLGRAIWEGSALPDTGIPERVGEYQIERVLRAPVEGVLEAVAEIGDQLSQGQLIARVAGQPVVSPFNGVLRGLVMGGLHVRNGEKIGDVDPRGDARLCWLVSDKALAIGGGVLEAILSQTALRLFLCVEE